MAITRMQQPRQLYGLGSFVKKATNKITRPFTKVASKIVPKEIAGIMRVAAPFLPPVYRQAAYLLGTAKQTGRISPIDLALTAAPTFFNKTNLGQGIADRVGNLRIPGIDRNLRQIMFGTPKATSVRPTSVGSIIPGDAVAGIGDTGIATETIARLPAFERGETVEATSGLFGKGGKMFQLGKDDVGIFDTKVGQTLFGKEKDGEFVPSFTKLGSMGISALSLIQDAKTPDEAGTALAAATGDSDDYERGYQLFSQLTPELFEVPEQFRAANGGRIGFSEGGGKDMGEKVKETFLFDDEFLPKDFPLDFKKFMNEFEFENERGRREQLLEMFKKYMQSQRTPILEAKNGGIMRTNYSRGTDDKGVVNPFQPKPQGPVLPDDDKPFTPKPLKPIKMAESGLKDYMEEFERVFPEMIEKRGTQEYMDMLEEYFKGLASKDKQGIMMASAPDTMDSLNDLSQMLFNKNLDQLTDEEYDALQDAARDNLAAGGRANLALGSRPTAEESGLGGLPIEADMRYTGGSMPYGAKEKADDVPARLSKNEFVFTADAVRAAGGGSVNEGAKKMYQAMKQLEKKPEAKGMIA